jgi:phosphoenolpyruvate---glycerone phosphotransferase subunit DhaL
MQKLNINDIKYIFKEIKLTMIENRDYLIELDGAMGDGDLGITMVEGFNAIVNETDKITENDIGVVLGRLGMIMANSAPSTLGTIIATAIMKSGKQVRGMTEISLEDIVKMGEAAVEGIKQRGKAEEGEKTILDSIVPAVNALKGELKPEYSLESAFENAYHVSLNGAESTKNMISKHGRAAWYGEKSIGRLDPGATAGMLIFKAIYSYIKCKGIDNTLH